MPLWLTVGLGVLGAVLAIASAIHAMLERQTRIITSEMGRTLAMHIAECPARSRAVSRDDDSGELEVRHWSPSGKLIEG